MVFHSDTMRALGVVFYSDTGVPGAVFHSDIRSPGTVFHSDKTCVPIRVGPQVEKSPNLHITRDSTGSIHENVRGKKFDPKKVRLGWGDLI